MRWFFRCLGTSAPGKISAGLEAIAEVVMSTVYNPESEIIARIERLELEARDIRKRVEHAHSNEDKRVLNRQLAELKEEIDVLRSRLP
jgi:hypothetical protein